MAIKLSLNNIKKCYQKLRNQNYPIIHLAGTNGKGSTSQFIDELLTSNKLETCRFNSPQLLYDFDCIKVNNQVIKQSVYDESLRQLNENDNDFSCLSNFEKLTLNSLNIFGELNPRVSIIEVGMGGLSDATNVIDKSNIDSIAIITLIDFDHQFYLGDNINDITMHKIGIINEFTNAVIVQPQIHSNVLKLVEEKCNKLKIPMYQVTNILQGDNEIINPYNNTTMSINLNMKGYHQLINASTALLTLYAMNKHMKNFNIDLNNNNSLIKILEDVQFIGRYDSKLLPPFIVDGAHNKSSIELLRSTINENEKCLFILSISHDKDIENMLKRLLNPIKDEVYLVNFNDVPSMPWVKPYDKNEIKNICHKVFNNGEEMKNVKVFNQLSDAINESLNQKMKFDKLFITGSLYLITDVIRFINDRV